MLLSCCFRGPAKKKHKKNKNWKAENTEDDEEFYSITKSLLSSQKEEGPKSTKKNSTQGRKKKDRKIISSEIHQKLQKEKEELKVQRQSFAGTVPVVGNKSSSFKNGIIDPTVTNIIPQDVSRMFASAEDLEGSLLSLSSAHQSLQISSQSLVPNSDQETTPDKVIPDQPTHDDHHWKATKVPPNSNANDVETASLSDKTKIEEEPKEANIEQVEIKEEERKEIIKKHIDESEKMINDMKHHHLIELEKVRQSYEAKLNEMKAEMMKNLEIANIEARNVANETISKLNKQVIQERGKIMAEQQENSKQLQEEFRLKNEQLNQSLRDIEERETSWQEERQDVLNEVQRLKADATRMAKLLAMEYEDDTCLGNKKRSLSQEVYSLQLVVEMRTGEVRNMREQMAKATQQLEQADIDKQRLKKVTARMEDLEEQLRIKNQFERQLSLEKKELELSVTSSKKAAQRMSQNVEELQWRIKNNFDLPVEHYHNHTIVEQEQQVKLETERTNTHSNSGLSIQSAPLPIPKQKSLFAVSPEMLEATSFNETNCDEGKTSDFSPSSGEAIEFPESEEEVMEYQHDSEIDGDSLDEGLGDISSDETTELLVPEREESIKSDTHDIFQSQAIEVSAKSPIIEKERRPSRISFETPL